MSVFKEQKAFMDACDQKPSRDLVLMYLSLVDEEVSELHAATREGGFPSVNGNHVSEVAYVCDALLDIIYVSIGAMHAMGIDPQPLWDEVQRSNMAKVDPETGKVRRREDGKILKPDGWSSPNLIQLVMEQSNG